MAPIIASCMSGNQAIVLLVVLSTPFWVPFAGYPLQWACRIARVSTPDFNRALQISFAESIVAILLLFSTALAYFYLTIDLTTTTGVVGPFTAGVAIVVPLGVYVPMMRVTYPKALLIAALRYAFTLSIPTIAVLLLLCFVALVDRLT
jgi:hypothetical protein